MKILFTNKSKRFIAKNYEYAVALSVLFGLLIYFSVPTSFQNNIGRTKGIVKNISLEREHTWSRTAGSKGYRDFHQITIQGQEDRKYIRYSKEELKSYGINNLLGKEVEIKYFRYDEYNTINELIIEGEKIINGSEIGLFPFLIFVGLIIITLIWSIWGFYITYLVSDEKRNHVLGK